MNKSTKQVNNKVTEFKAMKEDIIPLVFLCGLVLFIGGLLLCGMVSLDVVANDFCNNSSDATVSLSECSTLTKEAH